MNINTNMNLDHLAEHMGDCATAAAAATMRDLLVGSGYATTAEVPETEWEQYCAAAIRTLPHYVVPACPVTGEWLGEPATTGENVSPAAWAALRDTDAEHYHTYEHPLRDETGTLTGECETRAITLRWVRPE